MKNSSNQSAQISYIVIQKLLWQMIKKEHILCINQKSSKRNNKFRWSTIGWTSWLSSHSLSVIVCQSQFAVPSRKVQHGTSTMTMLSFKPTVGLHYFPVSTFPFLSLSLCNLFISNARGYYIWSRGLCYFYEKAMFCRGR